MPGCFHDVSRELVWVGGDASPFPLARPGCLAFQHATVNLFPGRQPLTLIPCQMKGCRPQLPVSHFVISGNKWTSPKSTGCSCIFLLPSGSWEVRRWVFPVEIVRRLIMSALPLCWLMGEAKHALAVHGTRLTRQMEDFLKTQLHATIYVICWQSNLLKHQVFSQITMKATVARSPSSREFIKASPLNVDVLRHNRDQQRHMLMVACFSACLWYVITPATPGLAYLQQCSQLLAQMWGPFCF